MANWSHRGSNTNDATLITTYQNDYIARGYGFALEDVFTIASGSSMNLLIDYTTYTDLNDSTVDLVHQGRFGTVFVLPPQMSTTAGPVVVSVYRGGDYSGGTPTLYSKRNTLSDVEPQITITKDATGTDKGTLSLQYLVGSLGNFFNQGGGSSQPNIPFIRDNQDTTLVEIVNNSGEEIQFSWNQIFYEI